MHIYLLFYYRYAVVGRHRHHAGHAMTGCEDRAALPVGSSSCGMRGHAACCDACSQTRRLVGDGRPPLLGDARMRQIAASGGPPAAGCNGKCQNRAFWVAPARETVSPAASPNRHHASTDVRNEQNRSPVAQCGQFFQFSGVADRAPLERTTQNAVFWRPRHPVGLTTGSIPIGPIALAAPPPFPRPEIWEKWPIPDLQRRKRRASTTTEPREARCLRSARGDSEACRSVYSPLWRNKIA